ncbi:MAG: hypothetical protein OEZ11_06310 [Gammaproteobacteria bacterium]|nr:hypothetical protein [Gammaproteobacteria bacterium]
MNAVSRNSAQLICIWLALLAVAPGVQAQQADPSLVATTDRYEFHSNFWVNLHHFLYAQAKKPDDGRLPRGRSLSREQWQAMNDAITWYREHLADRDLLLDERMYNIKRALIRYGPNDVPDHAAVTEQHRARLEAAARVYRNHYWPRHDHQNRAIWAWHESLIRALENGVLDRIADLANEPWPDGPIRVDLTWDANWAGAYCTTRPVHAVITSRQGGPDNSWPPGGWLELLFHEPSHALIDPNSSAVAKAIAAAANELDIEPPRGLWHGVLFYLSGSATREGLAAEGVEHSLLMHDEGIFSDYHAALLACMPAYLAGDIGLDEAMLRVLKVLQADAN